MYNGRLEGWSKPCLVGLVVCGQTECWPRRKANPLSVSRIYLFTLVSVFLQMCMFPFLNRYLFFSIITLILTYSELGTP